MMRLAAHPVLRLAAAGVEPSKAPEPAPCRALCSGPESASLWTRWLASLVPSTGRPMAPWTALGSVRGYPPSLRGLPPRALCWHACQPPVRASPGVSLRPALSRPVGACSSAPHPRVSRPRAPRGDPSPLWSGALAWRLAPSSASGPTTRCPRPCTAEWTRVPHQLLAGDLTLRGVARCEGLPRRPSRSVAGRCLWRLATRPGSSGLPSAVRAGATRALARDRGGCTRRPLSAVLWRLATHSALVGLSNHHSVRGGPPVVGSIPRWLCPPVAERSPVAPGHSLWLYRALLRLAGRPAPEGVSGWNPGSRSGVPLP